MISLTGKTWRLIATPKVFQNIFSQTKKDGSATRKLSVIFYVDRSGDSAGDTWGSEHFSYDHHLYLFVDYRIPVFKKFKNPKTS